MTARLMVVDDDPANARFLEAALSAEYYEVKTICDAHEAVAGAAAWQPDVILLDVMMPRVNGYEICEQLKSDDSTRHIPVVMVTGLKDPADRRRGLAAGADEFLTKPIEHEILLARLRGIIRLKRVLDEWRARYVTMAALGLGGARDTAMTNGRALIVDDLFIRARRLQALLETSGITTAVVTTDTEACDAVDNEPYDLVILSLSLLSCDPLRLIAKFQSAALTRDTPLLMTAEREQNAAVIAGLNLGAADCMMMPLDEAECLLRVKNLIRRKRHQDALRDDVAQALALAVIDPLTKLYNRRYMMTHLERLCDDPARGRFAVLMIDVDHFKKINDQFGHGIGDKVLEETGKLLYGVLRKSDLISRFGGEEFVTVISGLTDERRAVAVAEKLRMAIAALRILPELRLSVSIGVAIRELDSNISASELIERADKAMYHAKRRGRNVVCLYGDELKMPAGPAEVAE
jgi:two-component system cell cycle response regulator